MRKMLLAASLSLCMTYPHAATDIDTKPIPLIAHKNPLPKNWAQTGVFMQIYVRAYQDSDGDGIGDLKGLISRLDYLKGLGITGIWLMPITQSQDKDHGYAVIDYRSIERQYGTLADFDLLIKEAHKRKIGVIMDYVMNHSSNNHPLFNNALEGKQARYRNWYVWQDTLNEEWTTFAGKPWRYGQDGYYYAVFSDAMPDFNLRNPEVIAFHRDNLKFWLNRGIDGFRFDAVGVLIENGQTAWENQPESKALMEDMAALIKRYKNTYTVCEAPADSSGYAQACGSAFAFGLQTEIVRSARIGKVRSQLIDYLQKNNTQHMGIFLANHDAFAGLRLLEQFKGDEQKNKLAAATLLTLPGVPFLYYGEEIGLGHAEKQEWDDHRIRAPMSWSNQTWAGFSTGRRIFRANASNFSTHNVASALANPDSLYYFYQRMIKLRRTNPSLATGSLQLITTSTPQVLAFTRKTHKQANLVLINYSAQAQTVTLDALYTGRLIYPNTHKNQTLQSIELPAHGIQVYRIKP